MGLNLIVSGFLIAVLHLEVFLDYGSGVQYNEDCLYVIVELHIIL